jgi:hypothetical protein
MTTNNLTMAQLLAFLFKQYGPESLKRESSWVDMATF